MSQYPNNSVGDHGIVRFYVDFHELSCYTVYAACDLNIMRNKWSCHYSCDLQDEEKNTTNRVDAFAAHGSSVRLIVMH